MALPTIDQLKAWGIYDPVPPGMYPSGSPTFNEVTGTSGPNLQDLFAQYNQQYREGGNYADYTGETDVSGYPVAKDPFAEYGNQNFKDFFAKQGLYSFDPEWLNPTLLGANNTNRQALLTGMYGPGEEVEYNQEGDFAPGKYNFWKTSGGNAGPWKEYPNLENPDAMGGTGFLSNVVWPALFAGGMGAIGGLALGAGPLATPGATNIFGGTGFGSNFFSPGAGVAETGAAAGDIGWLGAGGADWAAPEAFDFAAADAAGLAQMAADAGLTGSAAQAFVNAGGMSSLAPLAGMEGAPSWLTDLPTGGIPGGGTQPPAPIETRPEPSGPGGVGSGTTGLPIPPGATTAAGTALSRIIGGNATAEDWLSVLGTAGATGLGMYTSGQKTDALTDIANQQIALREPFLTKATGYLNAPESFYGSTEGGAAMEAILRRLSPGGGVSDAYKQSLATGALYDRYLNTVGTLGSLGLSGQRGITEPQMAAAGTSGGALTELARGFSDILNPKPQEMSLTDLMKLVNLTVGGERV